MKVIDAEGVYYRDLNRMVKDTLKSGEKDILLKNINGQRYIGDGITGSQTIIVEGTAGNDLAAYMNGLQIIVNGNAQDGAANTMNDGVVVIHGSTGDTLGYAMRGGEIFIRGNTGYRAGIHMKEYKEKIPVIVVGGCAGDFLGEYMAGGIIIVLGLGCEDGTRIVGDYCGTGMHGGRIYLRGISQPHKLGKEVKTAALDQEDRDILCRYIGRYVENFGYNFEFIMSEEFTKLIPFNKRPYGSLYAY